MDLQDRIIVYLGSHPGSKARELAQALKVDKGEINRILYAGLGPVFRVDGQFQWTVLQGAVSQPAPVRTAGAELDLVDANGDRVGAVGEARRTVARLKRGVPPVRGIARFAVGMQHLEKRLSALLESGSHPRWFGVTGEYGEGKSFFRALACERALSAGYAVASFDVNRDEGALHQPQRHLSVMLNTLQSPLPLLRDHQGIVDVLRQWLATTPREAVMAALARLAAVSPALRPVGDAANVEWLVTRAIPGDRSTSLATSPHVLRVLSLMSAEDLVGRSGYARFSAAYRLQLILEWLKCVGHNGLFLFIDEVDNVARQISGKGHPACFRTLAWYCSAPQLPSLRVIFAMTPEMREWLGTRGRSAYGEALRGQQTVLLEECAIYDRWSKEAGQTVPSVWETCAPLNAGERIELFRRIAKVHRDAWGHTPELPEQDLLSMARSSAFGTTRRWVRACAQMLDLMNQHPSTGGSSMLGQPGGMARAQLPDGSR